MDYFPLDSPVPHLIARSVNAGHALDGQIKLPYLTLEHIVGEGVAWGLGAADARLAVTATVESAAEAAAATASEREIDFLRKIVPARAKDLLDGGPARRA
ncbi:hypothetical protein [uncultured Arthrobacter sp.]|uniref:hypothetical protein n=1 Tax=uncultured Arthrobacter sp. TaxID=114050 RepID=UPI00262BD823|nr:hypothetical protein [uncultured Arthrobacter sp.]